MRGSQPWGRAGGRLSTTPILSRLPRRAAAKAAPARPAPTTSTSNFMADLLRRDCAGGRRGSHPLAGGLAWGWRRWGVVIHRGAWGVAVVAAITAMTAGVLGRELVALGVHALLIGYVVAVLAIVAAVAGLRGAAGSADQQAGSSACRCAIVPAQ